MSKKRLVHKPSISVLSTLQGWALTNIRVKAPSLPRPVKLKGVNFVYLLTSGRPIYEIKCKLLVSCFVISTLTNLCQFTDSYIFHAQTKTTESLSQTSCSPDASPLPLTRADSRQDSCDTKLLKYLSEVKWQDKVTKVKSTTCTLYHRLNTQNSVYLIYACTLNSWKSFALFSLYLYTFS